MERRGEIIQIKWAVFLVCLLQLYPLNHKQFDYLANDDSSIDSAFRQALLTFAGPISINGLDGILIKLNQTVGDMCGS